LYWGRNGGDRMERTARHFLQMREMRNLSNEVNLKKVPPRGFFWWPRNRPLCGTVDIGTFTRS
jgi:hypothetical protein